MLIENNQYLLNTIFFVYHKHGLSVKLLFYCPAIFFVVYEIQSLKMSAVAEDYLLAITKKD